MDNLAGWDDPEDAAPRRKRPADEAALAADVFGASDDESDAAAAPEEAPEEAAGAAWVDDDDELKVDLRSAARLRKLRKTTGDRVCARRRNLSVSVRRSLAFAASDRGRRLRSNAAEAIISQVLRGGELETRLRERFARSRGPQAWASSSEPAAPLAAAAAADAGDDDGDDAAALRVARQTDANARAPGRAAVLAAAFHPADDVLVAARAGRQFGNVAAPPRPRAG